MKSQKWTSAFILIFCCVVGFNALAQVPDDFLEDNDEFEAPPPPPPPTFQGGESGDANLPPPADSSGGGSSSFDAVKKRNRSVPFSQAQPEDITNENYPEIIDSFDYPNAEISDIVKAISELTGKNFIVEPSVRGKITIIAPTPITVAEAYKAFLSALAINGFTVVPSGKFLKIRQTRTASRDSIEIYTGAYTPNTDQIITRIIHLKHISAGEVNKQLRNLTSKDGELNPYEPTNSLIISDYGSNIERVMKILAQLDIQGFEEQLEVIPIRHAKAKDMADLIDQIINKGEGKRQGRGFTAGIPRFNRTGEQGTGNNAFSMVLPDDRTNAIIVVGNKAGIKKIRDLVRKLDYEIRPEDSGGVYVYYVKYGDAEKIAESLQGIAKDVKKPAGMGEIPNFAPPSGVPPSTSSSGSSGLFGGDVKITSNKDTNSLLVTASRQDYEVVLSLLGKVDIPKDQVYVEGLIMELNATNKNSWNATYYQFDPNTKGVGRMGFNGGKLEDILNVSGDQGATLGFGSGKVFDITVPGGGTTSITSFVSFIKFLKTQTNVNILSTPQIMALNNEEAEIEVGDNVPIGTKSATTGSTSTTGIDREKATIKLRITPYVSPQNSTVRLKVDQQIKQLSKTIVAAKNLAENAVVLSERSVKTNIVINDGETAVIGGLIREDEQSEEQKVPILGDIPIIGWLFKGSSTEKRKLNLLVFLTPKIIRSPQEHNNLLGKKLNERLDFVKNNYGGRDPYGKQIDKMYRKSSKLDTMSTNGAKSE